MDKSRWIVANLVGISLSWFASHASAYSGQYTLPITTAPSQAQETQVQVLRHPNQQPFAINYSLPETLVGPDAASLTLVSAFRQVGERKNLLVMRETSGRGLALCSENPGGLSCTINYSGQNFYNPQQRDQFIEENFTPQQAQIHLDLAHRFDGDPIGVLQVDCPEPGCGFFSTSQ